MIWRERRNEISSNQFSILCSYVDHGRSVSEQRQSLNYLCSFLGATFNLSLGQYDARLESVLGGATVGATLRDHNIAHLQLTPPVASSSFWSLRHPAYSKPLLSLVSAVVSVCNRSNATQYLICSHALAPSGRFAHERAIAHSGNGCYEQFVMHDLRSARFPQTCSLWVHSDAFPVASVLLREGPI